MLGVDDDEPVAKRLRSRDSTRQQRPERRLQSIARLLQGPSECVAITRVGDKVLVAANELFQNSQENATTRHIKSIMRYFMRCYRGETISPQQRRTFVILSFRGQCRKDLDKKKLQLSDEKIDEIMRAILDHDDVSIAAFQTKYGAQLAEAYFVLGQAQLFYRDIKKVEDGLQPQGELRYLFNGAQPYEILTKSTEKGVHAEAQLIEEIIRKEPNESYGQTVILGISKLCCTHCYELVQASNSVLGTEGSRTRFEISGRHDIAFANWTPPDHFDAGFRHKVGTEIPGSVASDPVSKLAFDIGHQTMISAANVIGRVRHVVQRTSLSESDISSVHRAALEAHSDELKGMKTFLENLSGQESTIALLEAGMALIEHSDTFRTLFHETDFSQQDHEGAFARILAEMSDKGIEDSVFFKSFTLERVVGPRLCDFFKDYAEQKLAAQQRVAYNPMSQGRCFF